MAYTLPTVPPLGLAGYGYKLAKDWTFGSLKGNITNLTQMRNEFYTRYVYANGTLDTLNDEWEVYRDNNNHAIYSNALALIARVPGEFVDGKIESGMLRSKWVGRYGYYESSIKVPKGLGMWPAFWLNPQDAKWPPEIDIMEIVNNGKDAKSNMSFHIAHQGDRKSSAPTFTKLNAWKAYWPGFDYSDKYARFGCLWEPTRIRYFVNEILVDDRPYVWKHSDGTDGGMAHILCNLAVGGAWPGPPEKKDFPATMGVEYIRVWQNKNSGVI